MNIDNASFSFMFWGVTISVTFQGVISAIGVIIGIAGVVIGFQRNREMKRSNDLKERELDAKAKNSTQEAE